MSAPKKEGPTLWAWLIGRVAHPPRTGACPGCGEHTDAPAPEQEGQALCHKCRRAQLLKSIARQA